MSALISLCKKLLAPELETGGTGRRREGGAIVGVESTYRKLATDVGTEDGVDVGLAGDLREG